MANDIQARLIQPVPAARFARAIQSVVGAACSVYGF